MDAYPAIIRSFNYALQKLGYPEQSDLTIRRAVGSGDGKLLEPFIKRKDLKRALYLYRNQHKRDLRKYSYLFPHAESVLTYLKNKGYKLAVASNRPTEFSWILIRHLKIARYFDYVLCADRLKYIKPHPEILNRIMRKFSFSPDDTLYVGDMVIDAQAGRSAGIKTVIVTTGSSTKQEIEKQRPYRIIGRLAKLLKLL